MHPVPHIQRYRLCKEGVDAHIARLESMADDLATTQPAIASDIRAEVAQIRAQIDAAPLK